MHKLDKEQSSENSGYSSEKSKLFYEETQYPKYNQQKTIKFMNWIFTLIMKNFIYFYGENIIFLYLNSKREDIKIMT